MSTSSPRPGFYPGARVFKTQSTSDYMVVGFPEEHEANVDIYVGSGAHRWRHSHGRVEWCVPCARLDVGIWRPIWIPQRILLTTEEQALLLESNWIAEADRLSQLLNQVVTDGPLKVKEFRAKYCR